MKKLSSIGAIAACILATSVVTLPISPASAQLTTPSTTPGNDRTTNDRTYQTTNDDNRGLWGLTGLVGLLGLLGSKRRTDDNRSTVRRDDETVYRNPGSR
jgi:hypothetical protein